MTWQAFYLICFALGLSLTFLSALGVFGHLHFGHFHLHTPLGRAGHGHMHVPHTHGGAQAAGKVSISPVNGFTLAAFLCWFGGCGYLLTQFGSFVMPVVLGVSTLTGLAGAAILFWFLVRVLMPHERELTAADTEILGMLGRVSGPIREGGTGEILFSQNGSRRFAHARSEEGVAIPRDTEVVVMRYEQGIAYVRRWEDIADEAAEPGRGTAQKR
ncbi:NfeD family protein [Paracidobacterium acidisoli]|uniref:Membrane protein NfeD2 N-terminal transmembrane domain-containing protein n=1 Tax=Paracidobacterium acidisoli TaxID=2303751 RepID=A0A372IJ22_9BACT|nr:NfeD family protein [Paracidobacterium acidisoli]MBT9333209.1 NfeD family protein [Paracidobacterium acidisoli]